MSTNVVAAPPMAAAGRIRSGLLREVNATFAIAWREILSAIRNPVSIAVTIIIPVIFMGILGGSISQNLGDRPPVRLPPVHAHRHDREHPLPGDDHRASRTSSRSARTTSRRSCSSPPSRATPC